MFFSSWFGSAHKRTRPNTRLTVEPLEDRSVPASGLSASLVADVLPGAASSDPRDFAVVNGALYFSAADSTGGQGLYRSDGTAAGTTFLKTVGPLGGTVRSYVALGSNVYFNANESLWRTDGTAAGTTAVGVAVHGEAVAMGGKLYFAGDGSGGIELWVSNGTKKGSKQLKDIDPTSHTEYPRGSPHEKPYQVPNSSNPSGFVVLNNVLLFAASDGTHGRDLWRSNGTARGTGLVMDLPAAPEGLTVMGSAVYFAAAGGLWKTDGTTAGTTLLRGITSLSPGGITNLTAVGGTLYFTSNDPTTGPGLWQSDGTAAGTVPVANVAATNLVNVAGRLYFAGTDATGGTELWTTDGTATGTVRVKDIQPGAGSANPGSLTNINGLLYFAADDGASGRELWQSDGTAAGTVMVRDIFPGATASNPAYLVGMNNKLYFAATDPDHGRELWDPPPVPSREYLLVPSFDTDNVLRYDATTGAFVDEFVSHKSGRLNQPNAVLFGPHDHDLYVTSGFYGGPGQLKAVLRYDGETGALLDQFTQGGQLNKVANILFGPDGNLYVGTTVEGPGTARVARYDRITGTYLGDFVPPESGGLKTIGGMVFGPSVENPSRLDLYIASARNGNVLRFNGTTGVFLGDFVPAGLGGLTSAIGITFGPDGNLYVASSGALNGGPTSGVFRYQGPAGGSPGAFIDAFVTPGSGGLLSPFGVLFGPDANGDGRQDLYVGGSEFVPAFNSKEHSSTVKVYDGTNGAYLRDFVTADSGGLGGPGLMTFTQTDPTTLAYRGSNHLTAASLAGATTQEMLAANQVQSLLTEAVARWQTAGADTFALGSIQIQIANLRGATLGIASGHTIWLDDNAAGWGWFVDLTPWNDSEFTTPGDQGEQSRMDLLSVLEHEIGHLVGYDHELTGVMDDTLAAGTRRMPSVGYQAQYFDV